MPIADKPVEQERQLTLYKKVYVTAILKGITENDMMEFVGEYLNIPSRIDYIHNMCLMDSFYDIRYAVYSMFDSLFHRSEMGNGK
ncbi:hypothetical protein EEL31_23745 [Brevibacillus laterosporus]|nr:hypothetical protein [Brevibacillus laterosporus]TPG71145.1 hypothetical protein EEL31_23745 [Brevibacillus laterosporus]